MPSIDLALTLTLQRKCKKQSIEDQYLIIKNALKNLKIVHYLHITAVAELHQDYNLHCHAIIRFINTPKQNMIRLLYDHFRDDAEVGFICIKPVTDYTVWMEYITKSILFTKSVLYLHSPVIMDDYKAINQFAVYEKDEKSITT